MTKIHLPPSDRTPEVILDFATGMFLFKGESYPQSPEAFLEPIRIQIGSRNHRVTRLTFNLALIILTAQPSN